MQDVVEVAINKVLKDFRMKASKIEAAIDKMTDEGSTETSIINTLLREDDDELQDGLD